MPSAFDNPMMIEQLKEIVQFDDYQFMVFAFTNSMIVPPHLNQKMHKSVKKLGTYTAFSIIGGSTLNLLVKKVWFKFLELPSIVRIPARFGIFGLPFLMTAPLILK